MLRLSLLAALVASVLATHAEATSTRCTNPQREGARASGTISLAWSDRAKLDALLQHSDETLGMSYSWVESGLTGQPSNKKHFILC
jgi:hypothetical protein